MEERIQKNYDIYYIGQKNSPKKRLIQQPSLELKQKQKSLIELYEHFPLHEACSCKKGSGPIDAALPHLGAKYLLKVDISNCYQNITPFMAHQAIDNNFPDGAIKQKMLNNLDYCFIQWQGRGMLPTGAPTSPIICNIVLTSVDYYVSQAASRNGYTYTRYMDDLNLSTKANEREWRLIELIKGMIQSAGFPINKKKTKWYGRGNNDAKIVAGVSLDSISRRQIKRLIRARLNTLALNKEEIDPVTRGYLAYIRSIDEVTYHKLSDYFFHKKLRYESL